VATPCVAVDAQREFFREDVRLRRTATQASPLQVMRHHSQGRLTRSSTPAPASPPAAPFEASSRRFLHRLVVLQRDVRRVAADSLRTISWGSIRIDAKETCVEETQKVAITFSHSSALGTSAR